MVNYVIGITNNKGGVGKTFLTTQFAWYCALIEDFPVLVMDCDYNQADSVHWLSGGELKADSIGHLEMHENDEGVTFCSVLDISDKETKEIIKNWNGIVILDGKPSPDVCDFLAVIADEIIIPVDGGLSVKNTKPVLDSIRELGNKPATIVFNRFLPGSRVTMALMRRAERMGKNVKAHYRPIPMSQRVIEAEAECYSIWDGYDSRGVHSITEFFEFLADRIYERVTEKKAVDFARQTEPVKKKGTASSRAGRVPEKDSRRTTKKRSDEADGKNEYVDAGDGYRPEQKKNEEKAVKPTRKKSENRDRVISPRDLKGSVRRHRDKAD